MDRKVWYCFIAFSLLGCAGERSRFHVPKEIVAQQVRVVALTSCQFLAPSQLFKDMPDSAQYRDLICSMADAQTQHMLEQSGHWRTIGVERCRFVKDSLTQMLNAAKWESADPAESWLTQSQLFTRRYCQSLKADALLFISFTAQEYSEGTVGFPTIQYFKNIGVTARLVSPEHKVLWENIVVIKPILKSKDRAVDVFKPDCVQTAVNDLLADFTIK
jgi:hypothetical protein